MATFKRHDTVCYGTGDSKVRAMVTRVHRDGSVTVQARFFVRPDGTDLPGFLGYKYRMDAGDLRPCPSGA